MQKSKFKNSLLQVTSYVPTGHLPKGDKLQAKHGFSIVEALLASSLFIIMVSVFVSALLYGEESTSIAGTAARGTYIGKEGLSATRNIRDAAYSNLTNGTNGLSTAGNIWSFLGSSDITDIFTRSVTIADVSTGVKSATSAVTWQSTVQRSGSASLITYFSNWIASSIGNWSSPSQQSSVNFANAPDALKLQTNGNYAYVTRDITSGNNFIVMDISNLASPSIVGVLVLNGIPIDIAISGNYAYVASSSDTQELQIVNISNPVSPTLTGSYNATGAGNGNNVFIVGTTAYLTRATSTDQELFILNVSNPASPTLIGSLELNGSGSSITVAGNYAYIASNDDAQELKVVDITTPSAPTLIGGINFSGTTDGLTIAKNQYEPTIYLGRTDGFLYIIDVTTPSAPSVLSSLDAGGSVNDISLTAGDSYAFLVTSNATSEFRLVDVFNTASPTTVSTLDLSGIGDSIAYNESKDRAIIANASDTEEFIILKPN